jgi:xylulokinase
MGIDLGSTTIKSIIYDLDGKFIASGSRPTEVSYLDSKNPQWCFWDPDKIWSDTGAAIQEAVSKIYDPHLIKGVAVTGMGMDGLPIDKQGNWLYPFISWHCTRTEPQSRLWLNEVGAEKIFSMGGNQVLAINTIYRLIWMKENHPEVLSKTDKWLLIEDYINFMLCGRKATDYSMASTTSVLDQKKRSWSEEFIKIAGINKQIFPELMQSGTYLGEVTSRAASLTGLLKGTPVILGGHDYLCAALAVGAFTPDVTMDITGTWEMVIVSTPKPYLSKKIFKNGLIVESHVIPDTYCITAAAVSADMLEWFRRNYSEKKSTDNAEAADWEHLINIASDRSCGSGGVIFLPHFSGRACPNPDNRSLGAFAGLSNSVEKGDMVRAIFEGLNYQFREMVEAIEGSLNMKSQKVVAVGGSIRNTFWMQNKADVTGKVIEVPDIKEASALGAAILAGIGVGIYGDNIEAFERTFKSGKLYKPNGTLVKKYNEYFGIYKKLYPSLKSINREIFKSFKT